jgi:hypothetical protein
MALRDYYQCDICAGKCFYDASLNYSFAGTPVRDCNFVLDMCGDIKAICVECLKTHKIKIVKLPSKEKTDG